MDLIFHTFLYLMYVFLFCYIIYSMPFFSNSGINTRALSYLFIIKAFGGIVLTLVFTYYYTDPKKADIYRYFTDSKIISSIIFHHPLHWLKIITGIGINDPETFQYVRTTLYLSHPETDIITGNGLLIRSLSILNYFSYYNIYIDTLFFNFITFTGLVALYKAIKSYFHRPHWFIYIPLFLLPTMVFWGSGLLKESLVLFGFSVYVSALLNRNENPRWYQLPLAVVALLIVASVKIYIACLLLGCTLLLPGSVPFSVKPISPFLRVGLLILIGGMFAVLLRHSICHYIIFKHNEFTTLAINEKARSLTDTTLISGGCKEVLMLIPGALANAILGPFLWQRGPLFHVIFGAENCLMLLLCGLMLAFFYRKPNPNALLLSFFFLVFALLNYLVIGLTVPVMGAVVHYRVMAMPFLLLSVLLLVDLGKVQRLLQKVLRSPLI